MPIIEDVASKKIDEGSYYTANYQELEVVTDGFARLVVKTDSKTFAHLTIAINAEGKSRFKTYINPTLTNDGTLPDGVKLTKFNRNTESTRQSGVEITYNPSVSNFGTMRGIRTIFGGSGPQSAGLLSGYANKTIINPNTILLIEVQNVSVGVKDIEILLEGYEVVVDA